MPRLRNKVTGVVVEVADGKTLDGYEPADAPKSSTTKTTDTKKSSSK